MKVDTIFFAVLLFSFVMISAFSFYGGMISNYNTTAFNASSNINESEYYTKQRAVELAGRVNDTYQEISFDEENKTGLMGVIQDIPFLGQTTVQVFDALQIVKTTIVSLWKGLNIGMTLISDLSEMLGVAIPPELINLLTTGLLVSFVIAIVALILRYKP